jgi:outer membrane protein TolC
LFAALLAGGLLVLPATAAQEVGKSAPGKSAAATSDTAEIQKLQKERIDVLRQVVETLFERYRSGTTDFRAVLSAHHDLLNARLDATDRPKERVVLLQEQLTLAEKTMQYAEARFQQGFSTQVDPLQAKALCLDIRIRLLREDARSRAARK